MITGGRGAGVTTGGVEGITIGGVVGSGAGISPGPGAGSTIGGVEGSGAGISVGTGGAGGPDSRAGRTLGVLPGLDGRAGFFVLLAGPDNREESLFELDLVFFWGARRPLAGFASSEAGPLLATRKVATKNKVNKWRLMILLLLL